MAYTLLAALLFGLTAAADSTSSTITSRATTSSLVTSTSPSASVITTLAIDNYSLNGFVGSIVSADVCRTTYNVACTRSDGCIAGPLALRSGDFAQMTEGPSFQQLVTTASVDKTSGVLSYLCRVSARTSATCTISISGSVRGQYAYTSTTTTYSASYGTLTVTAGTIPTGSCTSTGGGALPTAYANMVKVVAVPAAAAALAVVAGI
ncbi:hypothetical protein AMS68_007565 [Peltaster fructicola]|uniref:GPI anchored cell wall protein n=1 Tax=Peltaster fructicola TaxID=286661 RepID=A0A6H0Y5D0_9PEZI|nr:hypothetical protein AMS68_007565 [Peltaster fructicola]